MRFSLPSIKCSAGPLSLRLLPNTVSLRVVHNDLITNPLSSSRKLGGAAEHLIDGSERRICRLSFEFYSKLAAKGTNNEREKLLSFRSDFFLANRYC